MTNEEAREHMDMLIAHKDKALETHPYFKRCDSCIHSEERDGSNCYECIKGIDDKFEAQTTDKCKGCYYNDGEAHAECVVCDKKAQPTDADCISREAVIRLIEQYPNIIGNRFSGLISDIKHLSPVTPTNEDIKEAYLKGYDYGVKDWFKSKTQPCEDAVSRDDVDAYIAKLMSGYLYDEERTRLEEFSAYLWELPSVIPKGVTVTDFADRCRECGRIKTSEDAVSREAVLSLQTEYAEKMGATTFWKLRDDIRGLPPVKPKYTDEEIDKAQAVEQAYVDKMVELAVEETKRPKGKWVGVGDNDSHGWGAYKSHVCSECKDYYTTSAYEMKYCPNCGAEMEVE